MASMMDDENPRYRRRYNPLLDPMNPEFSHEQAIYRKDCNIQRVTTDNRHVVPYNANLLKKYQCHINVEFVGSIGPVKYLYKYIYKGHDCATIKAVENQQTIIYNEPEKYVEARYISPVEACWRLFKDFEIHAKSHTVVRLDIHLPGQDGVNLDQTPVDLADIEQKGSTLRAYFRHNTALKEDEANGKAVTYHYYHEMPEHYRWIGQTSTWQKNVNACSRIGRVHPNFVSQPELFFLRTLLFHIKKPTNFRDLYIVDGVQHATYKQACLARGLTYDDQQYVEGLRESASSKMPSVMRILFAQILILGAPENPKRLWELFKEDLAEDFIQEARRTGGSIEEAIKRAYRIIAHKLNTEAIEGRNFRYWVQTHGMEDIDNYEQDLEHDMIDVDESTAIGDRMYQQLNEKQREIVDTIIQALEDPTPAAKCFFIDGPGGTGKTFVYSTLHRIVTGRLKKVKCMAYTGIAAILLPSGQTTHRTFGLKVPLTSDSRSSIKPGLPKANALKGAHMCLMDEAPMMSKYGLHNIDELLRAICNNMSFGGKVMVLGGDFRQCCPVQQRANKSEILDVFIKRSHLWQHFKTYSLEKNMRADPGEEEFAKYLLKLGDGELEVNELGEIEVPEEIRSGGNLIDEIFGPCLRSGNYEAMKNRAILAPLNDDKDKINEQTIAMLPGEEKTYTSFNSVKDQHEGGIQFVPEFLNSINNADLPPHYLKLKKNAIIMLLRNLDVSEGMCNGTRLIVTELCNNIIKAKIITGEHAGRQVHLPRITLDSSKSQLGATMQRHQFPVTPSFAITIHKSQGQTFEFVSVLLLTTLFVHGMLYVAFSRVKRQSALKVLLPPENPTHTRNVVWKEVLNKRNSPAAPASPTRNYLDNMEDFAIDD
nr:uncharacterized protein LOC107452988 [Parasteatoda tepidariorum]